jgi:hypothetical protein
VSEDTISTAEPARRGRKPETAQQRIERLERALVAAKQVAKEAEYRRFAIVGEALLAETEDDEALRRQVAEVLRKRVTRPAARADIATLLV